MMQLYSICSAFLANAKHASIYTAQALKAAVLNAVSQPV